MEVDITEPGSPDPVSIPAPAPARPLAKRSSLAEYGESLLVTLLPALFGTPLIVQAFKIPSQSMEPTLLIGDHLLVNKFIFGGQGAWYEKILPYRPIRRGDIVVFKFPFDDHPHYVKRVVGLPGDRVRIINQHVYVNDDLLNEPYVVHDAAYEDPFGDNFPPAGRYLGFVDRSAVMGRPVMIYWSVEATPADYARRNFLGTLRAAAQNLLHLPARRAWRRVA